jgi:hypothetical protein
LNWVITSLKTFIFSSLKVSFECPELKSAYKHF